MGISWTRRILNGIALIALGFLLIVERGTSQSWSLWASGLPAGVYPRMTVAPNHDIFYTLLGTGQQLGYVYRANTTQTMGQFMPMPQIPRPASIQNNIVALGYNRWSEPLVGIYRNDTSEPWLFRFNQQSVRWDTVIADATPALGGHCLATAPDGTIYLGARWSYVYVSHDDGASFHAIDETAILQEDYPCYYPTFNGSIYNGAIFGIQVDSSGRVYAGTETAGVIYSDDQGLHWHPADLFACQPGDSSIYDTLSPMIALARGGNVAGLGFTKEQNLVWTGADMWILGWKNKLGFADFQNGVVYEAQGLPDYLIQTGQQVSRIVTTTSGRMFLHSGTSNGATGVGIYTSTDGLHWEAFNNGINGQNDGLSQGSLAVDGNRVFMATQDGKVWVYDDSTAITATHDLESNINLPTAIPNPTTTEVAFSDMSGQPYSWREIWIYNSIGGKVMHQTSLVANTPSVKIEGLPPGMYFTILREPDNDLQRTTFIKF